MKMTDEHPLRDLAHRATHRIPGVPAHTERPAGHQGKAHPATHHPSHNDDRNHSSARPPRRLAAWQSRIAAFFGREL
jgi:hypothetical protein